MKNFNFVIRGNDYDVKILSFVDRDQEDGETALVSVNNIEYEVHIVKNKTKTPIFTAKPLVQSTIERPSLTNRQPKLKATVKAPIPGSVIKVNVQEGDTVKLGDIVVILEAMKMQNEIQASKGGVIDKVNVSEGQNVLEGDVLVTID